jgi:hypothetical protein
LSLQVIRHGIVSPDRQARVGEDCIDISEGRRSASE